MMNLEKYNNNKYLEKYTHFRDIKIPKEK